MSFLIPEIPAAAAATAVGLTGLGAAATSLANNKDFKNGVGNAVHTAGNLINGAGAGATDLLRGIGENFNHGTGNSSYLKNIGSHNGAASSMAVSPAKPNVMSTPAQSITRNTLFGPPAQAAKPNVLSLPAHTSSVKAGTMSTPAYVPGISGVTDLPSSVANTAANTSTKAMANTDALVAEQTLPRLPKNEPNNPPKIDIPSIAVPALTLDQESQDIGRANNFSRGAGR